MKVWVTSCDISTVITAEQQQQKNKVNTLSHKLQKTHCCTSVLDPIARNSGASKMYGFYRSKFRIAGPALNFYCWCGIMVKWHNGYLQPRSLIGQRHFPTVQVMPMIQGKLKCIGHWTVLAPVVTTEFVNNILHSYTQLYICYFRDTSWVSTEMLVKLYKRRNGFNDALIAMKYLLRLWVLYYVLGKRLWMCLHSHCLTDRVWSITLKRWYVTHILASSLKWSMCLCNSSSGCSL